MLGLSLGSGNLRHDLGRCSEEWIFLKFLLLSMQQLCEGIGVNIDRNV